MSKFDDFIKKASENAKEEELLEKIAEQRIAMDNALLEKLAEFTNEVIAETAAITTEYVLTKIAEESAAAGMSPIGAAVAPSSPEAEAVSSAPTTLQEIKETVKEVAKNPNIDTVEGTHLTVAAALSKSPAPHEVAGEVVNVVREALDEAAAKGEVHPDEATAAKTVAEETAAQVLADSAPSKA